MDFWTVEHRYYNGPSRPDGPSQPDSVMLGVYTSRDAAWQAACDTAWQAACATGSQNDATLPKDFQRHIKLPDHSDLVLRTGTLADDGDGTVPRQVFFMEMWQPSCGHYTDDRLTFYRHRKDVPIGAKTAEFFTIDETDEMKERVMPEGDGFAVTHDGRKVWDIKIKHEPVAA